jgi:hypothetical protein
MCVTQRRIVLLQHVRCIVSGHVVQTVFFIMYLYEDCEGDQLWIGVLDCGPLFQQTPCKWHHELDCVMCILLYFTECIWWLIY